MIITLGNVHFPPTNVNIAPSVSVNTVGHIYENILTYGGLAVVPLQ
jgi:hypothetical protein